MVSKGLLSDENALGGFDGKPVGTVRCRDVAANAGTAVSVELFLDSDTVLAVWAAGHQLSGIAVGSIMMSFMDSAAATPLS